MAGEAALIGRYRAYPEYRPSEIESTTEMPVHWIAGKVKYVTESLDRIRVPLSAEERGARKGEYPYYGASGIIDYVDDYLFDEETILFGEDGANLIARSSPLAFLAKGKYWVNNHAHILRTKDGVNDYWVMCLENIDVTTVVSGSAQPKLTAEALGDLNIVYPPTISERKKIANFLDHETAKIDTLIDKQQQLITLLKEKRQAVISHAVTKGLNPSAPMRDSGVEWLGEVPALWKPIKFGITNASAVLGGNYIAGEGEDGIPVIKMGNLGRGIVNLKKVESLPRNETFENEHILKEGDFLFNTRNSLDLVGKVAIWRGELERAVYNSNILRITFYDKFVDSAAYVNYLFNSHLGLSQLRLIAKGTTSVAAIYYKELSSLVFAFPPLGEQQKIANFLDHETAKIDTLIDKQQQLITLIQEKRSALISAAVTGKIDVRNWVAPQVSNNNKEVAA
jgi:type I restriction enzyme S subunit